MLNATATKVANHSLVIDPADVDSLLEKEWLLCNSRGSYSSSTVIGCNTRRYHGLLVAAFQPPVKRFVTLADLLETVECAGKSYPLANFEFSDRLHPKGYLHLKEFRKDTGVHFIYQLDQLTVEKSIYLSYDQDQVIINYDFSGQADSVRFKLMPLVALRDFHAMQSSSSSLTVDETDNVVTVHSLDPNGPAVHLYCSTGTFERGSDWWYAIHYRRESQRGQDYYEDVWASGAFQCEITAPGRITLVAQATAALERPGPMDIDSDEFIQELRLRQDRLISTAQAEDETEKILVKAADQFIVRRQMTESTHSASILAGYHWFADWGRDTFIALDGLLLCTRRFDEAREVLKTFATHLDQGMIPNCFDDYGGTAHYNSVDASLWFVNAAYQYLLACDDVDTYREILYPTICRIIDAYHEGTRFDIHAEDDGLLNAGNSTTQLTWMDARCNGVSFTPRFGKAVEINALWINALRIAAETASQKTDREKFNAIADKAAESFVKLFWNEKNQCLNDCVFPDGTPDPAIRPNQIFAVSLPFTVLDRKKQSAVVSVVSEQLLTPYGLRSLSPLDSRYRPIYQGDQFQRDSAYHQGTVWGWLIGPFAQAYLKVNSFNPHARLQVKEIIAPLLDHLENQACLGSVSEIFDGNYPHSPKGCIAQAWSVAELLRIFKLLQQK